MAPLCFGLHHANPPSSTRLLAGDQSVMRTKEWLPIMFVLQPFGRPNILPTRSQGAKMRIVIVAFSYKMARPCQGVHSFSSLKPPPTFLTLPGEFLYLPSFVAFASVVPVADIYILSGRISNKSTNTHSLLPFRRTPSLTEYFERNLVLLCRTRPLLQILHLARSLRKSHSFQSQKRL